MKTLYKRIAHMIMALVMLVSLTATVCAAEMREFTVDDEPTEIYAILLETYGKDAADDYKWSLLANAGIIGDFNDIDKYEIGSKDDYKSADRRIAADEANWIIQKANKTGRYTPVGVDYAAPEAQVFDDVKPGAWYYEAVNAMAAGGLLTGYDDGLFHPDDVITVAQMATIMCKIYGITLEWTWNDAPAFTVDQVIEHPNGTLTVHGGIGNADAYRHYYKDGYKYHWGLAAELNWTYSRDTYVPLAHEYLDQPMLRAQVLNEMVVLYLDKYGRTFIENFDKTGPDAITLDDIPDADIIEIGPNPSSRGGELPIIPAGFNNDPDLWAANNAWTYHEILWAYNMGITNGIDNNLTCDPYGLVTRAQFCQMLYNLGITTINSVKLPAQGGLFGGSN